MLSCEESEAKRTYQLLRGQKSISTYGCCSMARYCGRCAVIQDVSKWIWSPKNELMRTADYCLVGQRRTCGWWETSFTTSPLRISKQVSTTLVEACVLLDESSASSPCINSKQRVWSQPEREFKNGIFRVDDLLPIPPGDKMICFISIVDKCMAQSINLWRPRGSLAGSVFEVYVYRLAADNMLRLHISEYDR